MAHKFRFQLCLAMTLTMIGCTGGSSAAPSVLEAAALTSNTAGAADTMPPTISLTGLKEMTLIEGSTYTEPGATAADNIDGSVTVRISGTVGSEPGRYTITYTASDTAGNTTLTTRRVIIEAAPPSVPLLSSAIEMLIVFDNGLPGEHWDIGLSAFDEAINFTLCTNDNGDACPNIAWEIVNDDARGAVVEISHSPAGMITGFFVKSSTPKDLTNFAGGTVEFDVRVISGDPDLTMKVDCVFPCTSGDYDLGPTGDGAWETVIVQIDDLVVQDLDLSQIDTGIVIWATAYTDTIFRLDKVRWIAHPDSSAPDKNPTITHAWTNPNLVGATSPLSYEGFTLLLSEEFDGSSLNLANWNYEIGTGEHGWGNNELQYYRAENTSVQEGLLVISVNKENFADQEYTSSRLTTKNKFSFKYGRVDIRAAMPTGQGLWPALWMLGENIDTVGWPTCGEIDITEMIGGGGREDTVHGTTHWNHENTHAQFGNSHHLSGGDTLANGFHVYSIVWTENSLQWYIDGIQYHAMTLDESLGLAAFRKEFFIIVNVAVGGNWPGSPNTNTQFPQYLAVDYIRVFQPD